jgi:hypothetical protein
MYLPGEESCKILTCERADSMVSTVFFQRRLPLFNILKISNSVIANPESEGRDWD